MFYFRCIWGLRVLFWEISSHLVLNIIVDSPPPSVNLCLALNHINMCFLFSIFFEPALSSSLWFWAFLIILRFYVTLHETLFPFFATLSYPFVLDAALIWSATATSAKPITPLYLCTRPYFFYFSYPICHSFLLSFVLYLHSMHNDQALSDWDDLMSISSVFFHSDASHYTNMMFTFLLRPV